MGRDMNINLRIPRWFLSMLPARTRAKADKMRSNAALTGVARETREYGWPPFLVIEVQVECRSKADDGA